MDSERREFHLSRLNRRIQVMEHMELDGSSLEEIFWKEYAEIIKIDQERGEATRE
jgi:hypothetical protein